MSDAALLQAFYDAYLGYFGEEADKVDPADLDAKDRATLDGIRAAIAAAARQGGDVEQAPGEAPQSGHEQWHRPNTVSVNRLTMRQVMYTREVAK